MEGVAAQLSRQLEAQAQAGMPDWAQALRRGSRACSPAMACRTPPGSLEVHIPGQFERGAISGSWANMSAQAKATARSLKLAYDSHVAMVDGHWAAQHGALASGVELMPLAEALERGPGWAADQLQALDVSRPSDALAALNTATLAAVWWCVFRRVLMPGGWLPSGAAARAPGRPCSTAGCVCCWAPGPAWTGRAFCRACHIAGIRADRP